MSYWPSLAQLVAQGFQIKIDSAGLLGVFTPSGLEVAQWDSLGRLRLAGASSQFILVDALPTVGNTSLTLNQPFGKATTYGSVATLGLGLAPIYGLDNRSGITAADGSPIVLMSVPAVSNVLLDAAIEIAATAFTSGTATYTLTYTENGVSQTIIVTATVINVVSGVRRLIQPDASTNVTVQLTGAFVATLRLSSALLQLAP